MFYILSSFTIGFLILSYTINAINLTSSCICTTVQCPIVGTNTLVMGNGSLTIHYKYILHNNIPVVSSADGIVYITPTDI